jgi:hypothetical protein
MLKGESLAHNTSYVWLFNQDLPTDTVAYVRVLTNSLCRKLTPKMNQYQAGCNQGPCYWSANVPSVACDQAKYAYIADLYYLSTGGNYGNAAYFHHSQWFPDWGSYFYWATNTSQCDPSCSDVGGGDSGHPTFLLINGELALIGPLQTCAYVSWPGSLFDELNAAIADLDNWAWNTYHTNQPSGYTATAYDLSGFPDLW